MKKTKSLKIQYQLRERRYDRIAVPELRLCGVWLAKAGFEIGEQVQIEISENQLILKPAVK